MATFFSCGSSRSKSNQTSPQMRYPPESEDHRVVASISGNGGGTRGGPGGDVVVTSPSQGQQAQVFQTRLTKMTGGDTLNSFIIHGSSWTARKSWAWPRQGHCFTDLPNAPSAGQMIGPAACAAAPCCMNQIQPNEKISPKTSIGWGPPWRWAVTRKCRNEMEVQAMQLERAGDYASSRKSVKAERFCQAHGSLLVLLTDPSPILHSVFAGLDRRRLSRALALSRNSCSLASDPTPFIIWKQWRLGCRNRASAQPEEGASGCLGLHVLFQKGGENGLIRYQRESSAG